jgi:hypothetical protein
MWLWRVTVRIPTFREDRLSGLGDDILWSSTLGGRGETHRGPRMKVSAPLILTSVLIFTQGAVFLMGGYALFENAFPIIDDLESVANLCLGTLFIVVGCVALATTLGVSRLLPWARAAALWLPVAALLAYLLFVAWHAYEVMTTPDIGWSWEVLAPVPFFLALEAWCYVLFRRPLIKRQFAPPGHVPAEG